MGEYLFIGSAVLSLASGTVLLCVNPRRNVNRAFFIASICISLWALGIAMAIKHGRIHPAEANPTLLWWLRFSIVSGAFLGWSAWLMRVAILTEKAPFHKILRQSWLFFCISCIAALIAVSELYIPSDSTALAKQRGIGFVAYIIIAATSCLWMLADALRQVRRLTGIRKVEMQFFLLSIVCACLLLIGSNLAGVIKNAQWLKQISPLWFLSLHGIAVWAVCYHKIFNAKQVILAVGQRLILFGVLAGVAVALSPVLNRFVSLHWSVFLSTLTCCALAAALDKPLRRWMGLDIELILQTPRRTIINWARKYADEDTLIICFEKLLRDWCQTDRAILIPSQGNAHLAHNLVPPNEWRALINVSKDGWLTPESLQRRRSAPETSTCLAFMSRNKLGALLAAPRGDSSPSLLVALGQKESLRPYTFPDIQVLLALVELMDNILTHARAAAHAAQLQKTETASMMSRGLAHDLSNLATPVSSFLVHMESRIAPGAPEAAVLADAKHSIGVMQQYIQESLFFTRNLILKIEPITARQLLLSVSRLCRDRAGQQGTEVSVESDPNFIFLADPVLVQRLLQNLVFNAIDASPPGRKIEVLASATDDGRTLLVVRDHGTGIAPEIIDHIFEPYFTTKESGSTLRGLGLGLAICRKIVDLHGGSIGVTSDVGQGTTFTIILPTRPATPSAPQISVQAESSADPTILRQRPLLI